MRYSLLSQFQGTLLGACLGDFLGNELSLLSHLTKKNYGLQSSWQKSLVDTNIAMICASHLIRHEGLDLPDWQETWKRWQSKWYQEQESTRESKIEKTEESKIKEALSALGQIASADEEKTGATRELEIEKVQSNYLWHLTAYEAAIACVPVAMLYHENETKLREKLHQMAEVWEDRLDVKLGSLAVGYAIALALREKLDPTTLIPKTINYLQEDGPLVLQLQEVQILLERRAGLKTAITHLSKNAQAMESQSSNVEEGYALATALSASSLIPISLGFYCFLSTTGDMRLAILRAARSGWGSQTCGIVGALSGAYNSSVGIPVEWRRALEIMGKNAPERVEQTGISLKAAAREAEIFKLANSLWAVWCGVYNPETIEYKLKLVPAVAATNVIRPR